MENKNEAVIANYIEKMMGERRQKIFESDEYIQQDNGDLDYLEERYSSLKIPYVIRRVVDDYIACLESRDERYADMSYVAGMGDAISLLTKMGMLNNQGLLRPYVHIPRLFKYALLQVQRLCLEMVEVHGR